MMSPLRPHKPCKTHHHSPNKEITQPVIATYGAFSLLATNASKIELEDNPRNSGNVESESWILSYLDVFVLIIALLVIMLIRTPDPVSVAEPNKKAAHTTSQPLTSALEALNSDHRVTVFSNDSRISVRLNDTLLFDSSKAVIKPEGKQALQRLVPSLIEINRPVIIEGHTDNTPINTTLYPSNWELSAARANSVLHFLGSQGVLKQQMSTANYADTRPVVSNDNTTSRSSNRRVNLLIILKDD